MNETPKTRLDKWLWAARFYKTRALAKKAIEGGKVKIANQRPKPSKEITTGITLCLQQGWDEKTILVTALSEQRRSAPEAATLYKETEQSIQLRAARSQDRKNANLAFINTEGRPTKKQRRQIHRFKEDSIE